MLTIYEASLILQRALSLQTEEEAENILRNAISRGDIGYDETRSIRTSPNETSIISGISPHSAEAVKEDDFSEFLNRRKHLFGLATSESKELLPPQ